MARRLTVLITVLAALTGAASAEAKQLTKYQVGGGMAGLYSELTIQTDGKAKQTGDSGDHRFTVSAKRLRALKRALKAARFKTLKSSYEPKGAGLRRHDDRHPLSRPIGLRLLGSGRPEAPRDGDQPRRAAHALELALAGEARNPTSPTCLNSIEGSCSVDLAPAGHRRDAGINRHLAVVRLAQQLVAGWRTGQLLQLGGQRPKLVDSLAVVLALVRHCHFIPPTGIRKRDDCYDRALGQRRRTRIHAKTSNGNTTRTVMITGHMGASLAARAAARAMYEGLRLVDQDGHRKQA